MIIKELLKDRTNTVVTVRQEDTLETAAVVLRERNIGALPVRDADGQLTGLLSERDIVRCFAESGGRVHTTTVGEVMTRDVIVCSPEDDVDNALRKMTQRHIRHLPVVLDGDLCGMLSMRDIMESRMSQIELEVNVLRDRAKMGR